MTDFYKILGINRESSPEDIKKAYRRLAAQHHPDRGGDTAKFQEIQAAYDTLIDPNKKAQYDNPQPQMGGFHFQGGMPPEFEDIFRHFGGPFGDMFGFRQTHQRNKTLNIQTSITLEEAHQGKDLIANLTLPSGREQLIEVKIPAGISDGMTLRLQGMGDDSYANLPRGDIHLTITVQPHPTFTRHGDDLIRPIEIDCVDAMLGKIVAVETIDKKTLNVTVPPGTQHGQTLVANGHGMPQVNDPRFVGRLLMPINVKIPTQLSEHQKSLLKQAFK